jgi:hypothetical protein
MKDPVLSLNTGLSYERSATANLPAERQQQDQQQVAVIGNHDFDVCPVTGQNFGILVDNDILKVQIVDWQRQIRGYRRIKRGSPTSYMMPLDRTTATGSSYEQQVHHHQQRRWQELKRRHSSSNNSSSFCTPEMLEMKEQLKGDMYDQIEETLQIFTQGAMNHYMNRNATNDDKDVTFMEDSIPLQRDDYYNYEYRSIFRHGPLMTFGPRTI